MTSLKRPALALAAAALMTVSLTACGGGGGAKASSAPTSASKTDFCNAWKAVGTSVAKGGDDEAGFTAFQDAVRKLKDVGTPSDITADARAGYEVIVNAVLNANWNEIKDKKSSDMFPGVSKDDQAKASSFGQWTVTECP